MRAVAALLCLSVSLAVVAVGCSQSPNHRRSTSAGGVGDPAPSIMAKPVDPDPRVGAVFLGGGDLHTCTGSVLQSAGHDLMLTAAHCLSGDVSATTFVPGFAGSAEPANVWALQTVYFDPRWLAAKDPHADYVIARLARPDGAPADRHLSSGLLLGGAPAPGTQVSVVAYPAGAGGMPIGCLAGTGITHGFPSLPCAGLVGGTSGAPWLMGSTVIGVIGGLDGGGCDEKISYSAPLDEHVSQVLARAEAGGPGDTAPDDIDSGC